VVAFQIQELVDLFVEFPDNRLLNVSVMMCVSHSKSIKVVY